MRRHGYESETDASGPLDCYLDYCIVVTPMNSASLFATNYQHNDKWVHNLRNLIDRSFIDIVSRCTG